MAKKGQIFRNHSPEYKLSVILDMRSNNLGYREAERKHNIHHSVLMQWERKYLEMGELGLMQDNRGRPRLDGKKRGCPPKLDKQVEKDLIAENQRLKEENEYLKMEIEYTKKLSALVQAREQREGKKHK